MSKTLYQKVFDAHVVQEVEGETPLIYIDRHLVHEVTSPQAFDGLRAMKRPLRRPDLTWATMDHNVSTTTKDIAASGEMARIQMETLAANCKEFGVRLYDLNHKYQGIVHVMGPELGITLPGTTIVCGDSHTATHGAFGSLAFGIGTSEVEHVMATQTLKQGRAKTMRISVNGKLAEGISAKDVVLAIIGKVGAAGGTGYVVEFAGDAITGLSMEGRMTVCNMAIELGAKAGMIAPDQTTIDYIQGKVFAPTGEALAKAIAYWQTLKSDADARFDAEVVLDAAAIARGRKVAAGVQALVVPGSEQVKAQAEAEGLDKIFIEAGFEWRLPGCSMCLAMNNDRLQPGERCASTSNRNFEGRQGRAGRTHLVSPAMAAAAAVTGRFADIRAL